MGTDLKSAPTTPRLATDCVVFDPAGRLLLIRRGRPPFEGLFALPGGFVDVGETVETACRRELREETGLIAADLELVGVYSDPNRDPRGHVCSVAFLAKVESDGAVAGDDAELVQWVPDWSDLDLAFDHARIVADALRLNESSAARSNP
jgi:8-oxo-dGTP diphosphatase